MLKTIEGATDREIWSVIHLLNARNVLPSEIHHQICQVYGDNAMSDGMVRKCVQMFNEGRENVHYEARSGCPSLVNADLVHKVNERVCEDRRYTISDLSLPFPLISRALLYDIVSSHLGYQKACARWMPKMLTEHKKHHVACALTFVMHYHEEGDGVLSRSVTGDETRVSHITPESQQQSLHWKHTDSPRRKKFKQMFSTRKMMCIIFWDSQGILLVEFLPQGTTINSDVYCETLKKLRCVIQNKRRRVLSATILSLHDNTQQHSAAQTRDLNTSFKWEQMDHPRTALIWRQVIFTSFYT